LQTRLSSVSRRNPSNSPIVYPPAAAPAAAAAAAGGGPRGGDSPATEATVCLARLITKPPFFY
jgi:hypothetical protein